MGAAPKSSIDLQQLLQLLPDEWRKSLQLVDAHQTPVPTANSIAVASCLDDAQLLGLAVDKGVAHICNSQNFKFESDLKTAATMILKPENFIRKPLEAILGSHLQAHTSWSFSQAREKVQVLSELEQFVDRVCQIPSFLSEVRGIADELFTNAVYNAPFVDRVTQINPGINRADQSIQMGQGHAGTLYVAHDEARLVVGCQDPYGTLNLFNLLRKIKNCYDAGVGESMNFGSGGAGIGSYMVFNSSSSYYAGVIAGVSTVICCSLPLKMSGKKRALVPRNINFFQIDGGKRNGTV